MFLTSSFNSSQPHRHDGPSSEFHDQLDDLHDGEQVSTPPTCHEVLSDIADRGCPELLCSPGPAIHADVDHPCWERLVRSPLAIHERVILITTIFSNRDEVGMLRHLCRDDAQAFIDVIYETLDDLDHTLRMRCLRLVCKICGDHDLLPISLAIPLSCDRTKDPLCCGGFADVWKGTSRGLEVAVKVLKSYQRSQEQIRRRFCKEVVMWSALRHPNVLPLLGATMTGTQFVMVSEWMVNGNINEFVEAYPDADRFELLKDVGRGLEYLHGQEMIHGDLKGANILMNRDGHACIADFSLLAVIPDRSSFISAISCAEGGTIRWMSPELLSPGSFGLQDSRPTKESDCYALGMVIYEVLSGRPPFAQHKGTVVILKVMGGERPERPRGTQAEWFTDGLWGMLECCWRPQPHDRPSLDTLLQHLESATPQSRSPSTPTTREGVVTDTDDPLDSTVTDRSQFSISYEPSVTKRPKTGYSYFDEPPLPYPNRRAVLSAPTPHTIPSPPTSDIIHSLPNAKQLEDGYFNLDELVKRLTEALADESQQSEILRMTGDNAVLVIECLDRTISSDAFKMNSDTLTRSRVFSAITKLSLGCKYLPRSYWIDPGMITLHDERYTSRSCADVYRGTQNGEPVAVKILRTSDQESLTKLKKRFLKEAIVWKHVSCPYVLKFNGMLYYDGVPAIVTPWMAHGNITEYLEKHDDVDRLRLLLGVVKGVRYLHNCNIAHGDIKASNILISDSTPPRPMLADFGFTRITTISVKLSSEQSMASFMAPELLLPARFSLDKGVPSKEADIYALGMTVYQVLTGKWPFHSKREGDIMLVVMSGERPPKPRNAEAIGMTEVVWDLLIECWREDRMTRPTIADVLKRFCGVTGESEATESMLEGFAPQLKVGRRDSVVSQNSSLTTASPSNGSDTDPASSVTTITIPLSSYDILDREEIFKSMERNQTRDDNTTKKNHPATRTSRSTMGTLTARRRDSDKGYASDPPPPSDPRRNKMGSAWGRVKRMVTGFPSPV